MWKSGDPFIWLAAGALGTALLMIAGLLFLILTRALGVFWPANLALLELRDGQRWLGPVRATEPAIDPAKGTDSGRRLLIQVGNRDLFAADFRWVDESEVVRQEQPPDAAVFERAEWGNFYGWLEALTEDEIVVARAGEGAWSTLRQELPRARLLARRIRDFERRRLGDINAAIEDERLRLNRLVQKNASDSTMEAAKRRLAELEAQYRRAHEELDSLLEEGRRKAVVLRAANGQEKRVPLVHIVRAYRPNEMSWVEKLRLYTTKVWEFVSDEPRESNTEGGIFPAIFGTVLMVLIMSFAVVPFGVLAALYLREYARQGPAVRTVRIAINNLAGVPSIVFGVFGLGFFVYTIGGGIDQWLFSDRLPSPTFGTGGILWASLTLALLTVPVVVVATEEALAAVPRESREGSYALGATKYETMRHVVLPSALPGVLTGLILAMARGAGEVAPLMITGVVKLAPTLPLDGNWPYLHLERKFMHLGFHIYDVGFQSPNVEAAKPMVYATTLLLVGIIVLLNLAAILLRARIRRRLSAGAF